MGLLLDCLVIDKDRSSIERLRVALAPEIQLNQVDFAATLVEGFEKQVEAYYNVCFVDASFKDGLDAFLRDMKKLGESDAKPCVFVELHDALPANYDQSTPLNAGFNLVVCRKMSPSERKVLRDALTLELRQCEINQKVKDVSEALELMLRQLDKVAAERKRGRNERFNRMIQRFVKMEVGFDEAVLREYFEELCNQASQAKSVKFDKVSIPQEILARNLPKLSGENYTGASHRVWEKLLKKFGVARDK